MVCPKFNSQNSNIISAQFLPVAAQSPVYSIDQINYAMWNVSGSQITSNKSLNQICYEGAKTAHSDMRSIQQGSATNPNDNHSNNSDMQKLDSNMRYSGEASSHNNSGTFLPGSGNNMYRNISGSGAHSNHSNQLSSIGANSDSNGSHNQGSSFGAQYNSANSRAKSQMPGETNYCNNGNNSPYSGWQGLNSTTSISQSNGWIIPNNISSRNSHEVSGGSSGKDSSTKDCEENMSIDNEMSYTDLASSASGSLNGEEKQASSNNNRNLAWHMPSHIGLLSGVESSMNSGGPNAWNANQNAVNPATSSWENTRQLSGASPDSGNNNTGMSPPKPHNSWAQAAGKGLHPPVPNSGGNNSASSSVSHTESGNGSADSAGSATKSREEIVSEIKVKAAVSDGWGQKPVNQDTPWDVPPSPPTAEIAPVKDPAVPQPVWRSSHNNGTEIWQNNLRLNKGVPVPVTTTGPPWGHTPTSNIGGHWGDDDPSASNTWNSGPPMNPPGVNWQDQNPNNPPTPGMWATPATPTPTEKHWNAGPTGASWNDGASDNGTSVWNPPVAKQRNIGSWSPVATPKKDGHPAAWELQSPPVNRRPPSGTGLDDGTAVWGNPQRQGKVSHWKEMPPSKPIMNSVSNMPNPSVMPPMSAGSMPPGPGMIHLPTGATVSCKNDMNTAMWNKSAMNRNPNWPDMPSHDSSNIGTWGEETMHNQMKSVPGTPNPANAPFSGNWPNQNNNAAGYWGAKAKNPSNWAEGQVDTSSWLGPSKQRGEMMQEVHDDMSGNSWPEGSKDNSIGYWNAESPNPSMPPGWAGRKLKGGKPLTRDLIWASKQFRLLIEMGYKREDAENALRNNNMNFDDALVELRSSASLDSNMADMDSFQGRKGPVPNNAANLLNAALSQNSGIGNITPALFQKLLQQQQQQNSLQSFAALQQLNNQGSRVGQNNHTNTTPLKNLLQQIQIAVHAGYLNPQILNQPMAPQTLQLIFQLLVQLKVLHQLQQQQQLLQNQHGPKGAGLANSSGLQLSVQLTQTKQRILNLQNQIAAQQALFLKQVPQAAAQQQHQGLHSSQTSADIFKPNLESMPALQSEFRDLAIKDIPLQAHHAQQSRLNQWKLPSYDNNENNMCVQNAGPGNNSSSFNNEFSRAPGPLPSKTSSSASSSMPNPGSNLHPLLSQGDSAWSSLSRPQGDTGWPETATSLTGLTDSAVNNSVSTSASSAATPSSGSMENKEMPSTPPTSGPSTSSASHTSYNLTDLVPEFEPGKPWKGTQLKNIEDDPHITPGSITRSPLSVNTIKDSELFWNSKSSPSTTAGNDASGAMSSSTWIFTPSNTTLSNSSTSAINKPGGAKSNWNSVSSDSGSGCDVWGSSVSKSRAPPGLSTNQGWDRQNNSPYLLLRNLTPQIDGSTLKTLCMQHGPLQLFHLSLNHGIALVRYSTREEATKAQSALNNCVLGNTTILSDIPNETEAQQYLVLLSNQNAAGNMSWPSSQLSSGGGGGSASFRSGSTSYPFPNTTGGSTSGGSKLDSAGSWNGNNYNMPPPSQLWSFSNTTSGLWGPSQSIGDHDSSTNASLNRFLPDDLLGGESM